jgi:dTDP-glucose 4,6-dehydratase
MTEKEKIIVIGSNCFSGASFVNYVLDENPQATVIGISRSAEYNDVFLPYKKINSDCFTFHCLDLNIHLDEVIDIIKRFCPDYIINFSAQGMVGQSWGNPEQWFRTNCIALMNLANALKEENYLRRFVQISSPEVYGSCQGVITEDAQLSPSTPYAASKAAGDLSLLPFFKNFNFPLVYTRATNVYGAYQALYRIIPRSIVSIKNGDKIPLHGGGVAVKSYIHIRDVCAATLAVARRGENGQVYHISPENGDISIKEVVRLICEKLGKSFDSSVEIMDERLGQDAFYIIDSTKIRKELGWKPTIGFEQGLNEVISWVEKNFEELLKHPREYIHKV